ncbi:extracellular lipase [Metarhizium acridum CQMa 102]|uniref:Extracellular lipase n=1 Tax=Metarhizium acridum (strain CQMa 102) TaxID=655827 RepID=E9EH84_METAQ|nr:extracellular lipase [Metarhizium acridum CQMa 102]EFY84713.1 extracellular lipase [Metarhizium acridum CQMa 102]
MRLSKLPLARASLALLSITPSAASPVQVDGTTLGLINTYSRYATAAYCPDLQDLSLNSLVCTNPNAHACGGMADTTTVEEFGDKSSISGYVAVSKSQSVIVVSFRGTDIWNIRDVMSDVLACLREPKLRWKWILGMITDAICAVMPSQAADEVDKLLPLCHECRVHQGFWAAFTGIKGRMMQVVQEQLRQNPGFKVVATGHSLGGGVATLAGAYLRKGGVRTDIYTYGSPRVGNTAFAEYVSDGRNGRTVRVTNKHDPVTVVPGDSSAGYAHTTPEFWFPEGLGRPAKVCKGVHNLACSGQVFNLLSLGDHDGFGYANGVNVCPGKAGKTLGPQLQDIITQEDVDDWVRYGILDNTTAPDAGA